MKLFRTPFTTLDWETLPTEDIAGERGTCRERRFDNGDLCLRMVDYGPGYVADHWCDRGHVLHVLSGEMTVVLKDGREVPLVAGTGFCVSDYGDAPHMVRTRNGCRAFIVD